MSAQLITARGVVYPWHCDHMGHMNVMWYVGHFDNATWQFLASVGVTPEYLRHSGNGVAAVDQRIAYRRELHVGDLFSIRSALIVSRTSSIQFAHQMFSDSTGELVASTILTGVHLSKQTRRSVPLPEDLRRTIDAKVVENSAAWQQWPPAAALIA